MLLVEDTLLHRCENLCFDKNVLKLILLNSLSIVRREGIVIPILRAHKVEASEYGQAFQGQDVEDVMDAEARLRVLFKTTVPRELSLGSTKLSQMTVSSIQNV